MKLLGKVQNISYKGHLIVRGAFPVKKGQETLTASRTSLGKVERIFGPVDGPYISIRPEVEGETLFGLLGKEVYIL